jgi:hypothetical protein
MIHRFRLPEIVKSNFLCRSNIRECRGCPFLSGSFTFFIVLFSSLFFSGSSKAFSSRDSQIVLFRMESNRYTCAAALANSRLSSFERVSLIIIIMYCQRRTTSNNSNETVYSIILSINLHHFLYLNGSSIINGYHIYTRRQRIQLLNFKCVP